MKISFRHGWAMLSAAVLSLTALPLSAVSSVPSLSAAAAAVPAAVSKEMTASGAAQPFFSAPRA